MLKEIWFKKQEQIFPRRTPHVEEGLVVLIRTEYLPLLGQFRTKEQILENRVKYPNAFDHVTMRNKIELLNRMGRHEQDMRALPEEKKAALKTEMQKTVEELASAGSRSQRAADVRRKNSGEKRRNPEKGIFADRQKESCPCFDNKG